MKTTIEFILKLVLCSIFILGLPAASGCDKYEKTDDSATGQTGGTDDEKAPAVQSDIPDDPVKIAFVPSVEAGAIETQLDEFEKQLGQLINHEVEATVVLSYSACIEQMGAGQFHAAMLPSLAYVLANDRYGIHVALKAVRDGSPTYRGEIITRVDSGINTLEDLKGKTFAFTDEASASGHLYPKTFLINSGIDPEVDLADYVFKGSHPAVVQSVLQGQVDAGACFDDARELLAETETDIMEKTKVIAYTPDIPGDTVSFRKDLTSDFWDGVAEAMMEMSRTGEESVLFKIYEIEELVPAENSDYDPIREMVKTLNYDIEKELD